MRNGIQRIGWVGLIFLVAGCAQEASRPGDLPGATVGLGQVSSERALRTAEQALKDLGYTVRSVDTVRGTLVTVPMEYTARDGVASISDVFVPSRHTYRNLVTVQVTPVTSDCTSVSVRVDVQRRDTKARQNFAYQRQSDDRPSNTPAFQTASVDREKSEVWTSIKRDPGEEQRVIQAIQRGLNTPAGK